MGSDRRPGTRLPEDPAYWEQLATRSARAAFGSSAAPAASRTGGAVAAVGSQIPHAQPSTRSWWNVLSEASFVLAASAALAVAGGSLLLDERAPPASAEAGAASASRGFAGALAPDDALLASLLNVSAGPPATSALLKLVALREEER